MKMTNEQIYLTAEMLVNNFNKNTKNIYLPAKINFFLQKNINLILQLSKEIEESRLNIARQYGTLNSEQTAFIISGEKEKEANLELQDLLSLTQEVNIHKLKLNDFENISLSFDQMSAILFMIDEE